MKKPNAPEPRATLPLVRCAIIAVDPGWGFRLGRARRQPDIGAGPDYFAVRRNSSTRSVRSQEKPPSGSGGRPKWP